MAKIKDPGRIVEMIAAGFSPVHLKREALIKVAKYLITLGREGPEVSNDVLEAQLKRMKTERKDRRLVEEALAGLVRKRIEGGCRLDIFMRLCET